jgi:hypothetical protein
MGWVWKLRLGATLLVEAPILVWIGFGLGLSTNVLASLFVVFTPLLYTILFFRPGLFILMGMWLLGTAGSSAYLLRIFPPSIALGLGLALSTGASAIVAPVLRWLPRLLLRRRL